MMSPPANRVQVVDGSKAAAVVGAGRRAVSGQSASLRTRSTPNRALPPHASARTSGSTSSARRNASRLRFAARSRASVSLSGARTRRAASVGRSSLNDARIASASPLTSSSPTYRSDVPSRTAATSSSVVDVWVARNWVTGTTGTSASGPDVAVATELGLAPPDATGEPAAPGVPLAAWVDPLGWAATEGVGLGLDSEDDEDAPRSPNGPAATTATIAT